jgi:hypothetical protein
VRSSALLCAAALACAGCYDDTPGLRLVIRDPGIGAVSVELFIATRHSMSDAVGADAARDNEGRTKLRGDSYYLDGPGDGTTPMTVLDVVDGKVVWNLQADPDGPTKMKLVVAVAYDGQGQAVGVAKMYDVEVPANDTVAYVLELEEANQLAPSETREPAGVRVWPWRKESAPTTAACLAVEYSSGSHAVDRIWLVPEDDPDCDEVEVECDKFYWHADESSTNGGLDDANCMHGVTQTPPAGGAPITTECLLGSRPCVDGTPPGTCLPLTQPKYCVANALCNPALCTLRPDECQNAIASTAVACTRPTDQAGRQCEDGSGSGVLVVDLRSLFPDGCSKVEFVAWDTLAAGVNPSPTHVDNLATFSMGSFEPQNCKFTVTLDGTVGTVLSRTTKLIGLDITLATDHVLLPLLLTVGGTCADDASCVTTTVPGEGLDRCQ